MARLGQAPTVARAHAYHLGMRKAWLLLATSMLGLAAQAGTAQLGWLAGCWAATPGEPGSRELWMAPAGGLMLGERSSSFHNPTHDSAQRVIYDSSDDNTLEGRVEGLRNGQLRVIRFPMKRTACPLGAS